MYKLNEVCEIRGGRTSRVAIVENNKGGVRALKMSDLYAQSEIELSSATKFRLTAD